jgi:hypothetical protein
MKPTKKTTKLSLNQETVRQLSDKTLGDVNGGAAAGPKVMMFSGGPQCTAGLACTFNWSCTCGCK